MAGILQTQWETLFGDTFATTPTLPYYKRGDTVRRKSDFENKTTKINLEREYIITDIVLKSFDDSGTERFRDANGAEPTNASSPSAPPGDETVGYFYNIQVSGDSQVIEGVHESDLVNESDFDSWYSAYVQTLT